MPHDWRPRGAKPAQPLSAEHRGWRERFLRPDNYAEEGDVYKPLRDAAQQAKDLGLRGTDDGAPKDIWPAAWVSAPP